MSNKPLLFPVLMLILVAVLSLAIINNAGLILFNILLGRPVYSVSLSYDLQPFYVPGSLEPMLKVIFNFELAKSNQPIESILHQVSVEVIGQETQLDITAITFQLDVPIHIYTGLPQRQIPLYDGFFFYNDNLLRKITIFLNNFDPTANSNMQEVFVEIRGSYTVRDATYSYEAGAALKVDI